MAEEKLRWIPITERLPKDEDEEGGVFYPGDDECSYIHYGLFVNAWMSLPEPYRG